MIPVSTPLIAGIGMVPFLPPHPALRGTTRAGEALSACLADARLDADYIEQVVVGHVHGDRCSGAELLAMLDLESVPVSDVGNGSASGATALFNARMAVQAGEAECVLALGLEQGDHWTQPLRIAAPITHDKLRADIVLKSRRHAARNDCAIRRTELAPEDVRATLRAGGELDLAVPVCGAAAVLVCSPRFAARHGLRKDVAIAAQILGNEPATTASPQLNAAAAQLYQRAGIGPDDIDVIELQDSSAAAELRAYVSLGLCAVDDMAGFVRRGANTYGGRCVVGPSGGMLANGLAPGSGGLAQIVELTRQLRGQAGARQVPGARTALQHNGGHDSALILSLLQRH